MTTPLNAVSSDSNTPNLEAIQHCVSNDMKAVDQVILGALHSEVALVNQIANYIIHSGGKRMRPMLALLAGGLLGEINPAHHQVAAIIEFIHTATLLHDDVVDESSQRRGKNTANALFGNAASILVGDFVYSRAFQMMVGIQNMRVMEVLSNTTNVIAEGEVLQLMNIHNADVTDEAYMQVIHYKTAKLFEAATQLGAIVSEATPDQENALQQFGQHMGVAFQLIDDVLDLNGDPSEIGKNLGDDIYEGKPTLPLIIAMREGSASEKALIQSAIETGKTEDINSIISAVKRTGAMDAVQTLAEKQAEIASEKLDAFEESTFKTAMKQLTQFAVHRRF